MRVSDKRPFSEHTGSAKNFITQTDLSPTSTSTFWVDFILRNPQTGRVANIALSVKKAREGKLKNETGEH